MKTLGTFLVTCLLSINSFSEGFVNILVYHHVSESTPASTSISPEQFKAHMQLLKDEGFNVVSLATALKVYEQGSELPERAIAITFDDGFEDIYQNAYPILKEFNYPFTLFVATDAIDNRQHNTVSWEQLREMKKNGVTIANHSTDHGYLVRHRKHDAAWKKMIQTNIEDAQSRLEAELGDDVPLWFAHPYGEFSKDLTTLLKNMGYFGFAQHSGGLWSGSNPQAIPRFAAAGIYANTKTLLTKLNSKPMPVDETRLSDMLTMDTEPTLVAELTNTSDQSKTLNCFVDGNWTNATRLSETSFEVITTEPLAEGRHRYNCTAKSLTGDTYYWFSKPWLVYPEFEGR